MGETPKPPARPELMLAEAAMGPDPSRHDALLRGDPDSGDASTEELLPGPESSSDAPIPLVRAILPSVPGGPRSPR